MNETINIKLKPPHAGTPPPRRARPERDRRYGRKRKLCPYCLFDLTHFNQEDFEESGNLCFLCRHPVLMDLLPIPIYQFTREQEWELLVNEMDYIWKAERLDVDSYIFSMGQYYNPDYKEAKERLFGMLAEKESLLRLKEEFLEAEGELDLLMIGHLNKLCQWQGNLGRRLFGGRRWRMEARRLSVTSLNERERTQFQYDYIQACPWGAFGSPGEKEELLEILDGVLKKFEGGQQTG